MLKPKLTCPEGHSISEKFLASLWGKLTQFRYQQRIGKKKYNTKKADNFKK